jgi:peptidoglycan/xylan/chitin deacetylase (PgdA/CDA1 family)
MEASQWKRLGLRLALSAVPFAWLQRSGRGHLIALYYHLASDKDIPHVRPLYPYKTTGQFRADLDFLLKRYRPVGLPELIRWTKEAGELPSNGFLLTFDDGFRELHDVIAPILLEKGVPATFFLTSGFLENRELSYEHKASLLANAVSTGISSHRAEQARAILATLGIVQPGLAQGILKVPYGQRATLDRLAELLGVDFEDYLRDVQPYLTSIQVKQLLRQGFSIGAHSIDHPCYSELSMENQLAQTLGSMRQIREIFGVDYGAFAFPHHDRGVSPEFFQAILASGLIDITFGTAGMLDRNGGSHRQRASLENPLWPARDSLAWQYARTLYRSLRN